MKITTKFLLAAAVVGSLSLTSCKDYEEGNYNEIAVTVKDKLQQDAELVAQLDQKVQDLANQIAILETGCKCKVDIVFNADGTVTVKDKLDPSKSVVLADKNSIISAVEGQVGPKTDASGRPYVTDGQGNPVYIPQIVSDGGKNYIQMGDTKIEIPAAGKSCDCQGGTGCSCDPSKQCSCQGGTGCSCDLSSVPTVSIDGDKITITAGGKTWEFTKTASPAACTCTMKLTWNAEKQTYTISDGTNPGIDIPTSSGSTCTCDFSQMIKDNNDGTITITAPNTTQSVTIKKTFSEVSYETEGDKEYIVIQKYNLDGTKNGEPQKIHINKAGDDCTCDMSTMATKAELAAVTKELYGEDGTKADPKEGSVIQRLIDLENKPDPQPTDLTDLNNAIYGVGGTKDDLKEDGLLSRVTVLETTVADLLDRVGQLEDARAKLITSIEVQRVVSPYGSFAGVITNLETQFLLAYYGKATVAGDFPTIDPQIGFNAGETLLKGNGNAGKVYVTINPNTVDFTGFNGLKLVNSLDQECGIQLGDIKPSNELLTSGYTRSVANGFYEAEATLDASKINDPNIHHGIDASKLKNDMVDAVKSAKAKNVKNAVTDLASVAANLVQGTRIPLQGVKASYTDSYGEHAVYSKYGIVALAQQPLGFYTVDGIFAENGAYWRGYDKAKSFIDKTAEKIGRNLVEQIEKQAMLGKIHADLQNIKIDSIDYVKISEDAMKMTVSLDTTLTIKIKVDPTVTFDNTKFTFKEVGAAEPHNIEIPSEFEYNAETGKIECVGHQNLAVLVKEGAVSVDTKITTGDAAVGGQTIEVKFHKTFNVDMTDRIKNIIDGINAGFSDTNKLLDALKTLMDDANSMIGNIRRLEAKIEDGTFFTTRLYKYTDKIANKIGAYAPMFFKPALLMNSNSGFGIVGTKGSPSTITSTNVTLIATSYSAEIAAPIYKKYIRVNGADGKIVDGLTVNVTLKKGLNKIEYYALDYLGNQYPKAGEESKGEYYIYVK